VTVDVDICKIVQVLLGSLLKQVEVTWRLCKWDISYFESDFM